MTIGVLFIATAFIASAVSVAAYWLYYKDRSEPMLRLANRAFYLMGAGIILSLGLLLYLILTHHFQVNYVYSYSSRALNKFYLFSTLWAGQQGTFLLWLFYDFIYGIILIRKVARKQPLVMVVILLVQLSLLLILLKKSPFSMVWHVHEQAPIGFTPQDGAGLNPLLQNPWMVIHPPTLFVGYSSTVVPFAFAMSAMFTRDFTSWIKDARPWIIFNVMVLGTGLIMGGYWAYVTLGWGGYWGWDPVENASLVPWLMGIGLLHGSLIQGKRNALIRTNFLLAGGSFLTMLWGSFLTRSGVLTDFSVHSFAPSGLSLYLILIQLAFTGFFLTGFLSFLNYFRKADIQPARFEGGIFNRETFLFAGVMVVVFNALVVLFGTSAPLYTGWFGEASSVSPDFYNTMIIPIVIFILITVGIAPLLAWKTSEIRNLETIIWSAGISLILTILAVILGLRHLLSIPIFFLAVFVISINAKITYLFIRRNFSKAGGYIVHVGIAFMIIGILTSSLYDRAEKVMLPQGEFEKTSLGYEVKFVRFVDMPDGRDRVKLQVKTDYGTYDAYPQFYYSDYSKSYMVSPDVKVNFVKDLYISPISYTPASSTSRKLINLGKGESQTIDKFTITFHQFQVQMSSDAQKVTADLTVAVSDNNYQKTFDLHPVLVARRGKMDRTTVEIPNTGYRVQINSVNASSGTVELALLLPPQNGQQPRSQLAVEITEKPLISILWFGAIVFIAGAFITLVDRARKRR